MLGDRRSRQVEVRSDLAGGQLVVRDETQDRAPVRRGDRLEGSLHGRYLSMYLRKKQLTPTQTIAPVGSSRTPPSPRRALARAQPAAPLAPARRGSWPRPFRPSRRRTR